MANGMAEKAQGSDGDRNESEFVAYMRLDFHANRSDQRIDVGSLNPAILNLAKEEHDLLESVL